MLYNWVIKPDIPTKQVEEFATMLNINKVLATILLQRGITNFDEAKKFFRPDINQLHSPFLMKDMDKAVERLQKAINNNEKILIYGDYDVDGTTAVSLMYLFLKEHTENEIDYYIPDRYNEGYGISFNGIDYAYENNFSLVIALDCGIKSIDKINYANQKGVDFIICDHHLPGETIPQAYAVLDPKQKDCFYPYKELCGCGIGFKLVQAFLIHKNLPLNILLQYVDLVAIAIAADIVPITDENRVLCFYGLQQINKNPRSGVKAILNLAGIKKQIKVNELVFTLAPRINAAGRIQTGKNAVKLLISNDLDSADISGQTIDLNNNERKELDSIITQQALSIIESNQALVNKKTTVVFNENWHKGVVGIVAARLTEKYYRPTIVLTLSNGKVTGSARSVKNFDVHAAIEKCADLLEQFGGHKYAAGLTLLPKNLTAFMDKFEQVVASEIKEHMLIPEIEIDAEIEFGMIDKKFCNILKQFEPFGPGNLAPVFLTYNVRDNGNVRILKETHLKMDVVEIKNNKIFSAIAFSKVKHFDNIYSKRPFDICYSIEENEFNNNTTIQLNIKDIKIN